MGSHRDFEMDEEEEGDDDMDRSSRRPRRRFRCPFCDSDELPLVQKRISTGGWIVFAALLLTCFPLFWIGLLMKEEFRVCYDCGNKLN